MLIIASVLFVLSAYGTGAVDNFSWFILYRIIGGLGIGIASNISPVYIAEVAPASVRGKFVSMNQLTIVLGILMAQLANWQIGAYYTRTETLGTESVEWAWRWMFWGELVPAGLFFILAFMIPESPRWLAANKRMDKAQAILSYIGGKIMLCRLCRRCHNWLWSKKKKVAGNNFFIHQSGKYWLWV